MHKCLWRLSNYCIGLGFSIQQLSPAKKAIVSCRCFSRPSDSGERTDYTECIQNKSLSLTVPNQNYTPAVSLPRGRCSLPSQQEKPKVHARHETFSTSLFLMYCLIQDNKQKQDMLKHFILKTHNPKGKEKSFML